MNSPNLVLSALVMAGAFAAPPARAQSTINATDHYAWSANTGWIDFRAERPNAGDGFRFGEHACGGYLWSPNIGWIHCGDGSPADGVRYGNSNHTDYGVNHDGAGNLSGLAWSANTGWINFDWANAGNTDRPRVNLVTGEFSGFAWSANCGWVNLATGRLKTDGMAIPDTDGDGISDVFELNYAGDLITMNSTSDTDGDGASDREEYIAGTDPLNPGDVLKITRISKLPGVNAVELEWPSHPARVYGIEAHPDLGPSRWTFLGEVAGASGTNVTVQAVEAGGQPKAFFRLNVKLPLQP